MPLKTHLSALARIAHVVFIAAACSGCATFADMTFKVKRETRFVNMDGEFLRVAYGEERRSETLPNGLVCTYEGKVRLRFEDGKSVVLYQTISASGMRYVSADKRFEFHEKGPYCIVSREGRKLFEGIQCRK